MEECGTPVMGRYCDQSTFGSGLLAEAPKAGKGNGKRWPTTLPVSGGDEWGSEERRSKRDNRNHREDWR